ncbi:hypothetical protein quinque_000731 [Culex quinquefasciatus]
MLRLSAACVVLVLVGVSLAEPPAPGGPYPDRRNGNGNGGGAGGAGGGYQQVASGQQTSEGQQVDAQLLDMVKMLLLQHESGYGSYGPPVGGGGAQAGKVTGIELEDPKQSMQVAEFWQGGPEQGAPSGSYGAPGASQPSGSYGAPSDSYGAPLVLESRSLDRGNRSRTGRIHRKPSGALPRCAEANAPKVFVVGGASDENRNLGRFKPVFTAQQERELVDYILAMEVTLYGVTSLEMRSLAYQLATINRIDHPFDNGTELAGKDWLYGFRMRHPELSLRAPGSNLCSPSPRPSAEDPVILFLDGHASHTKNLAFIEKARANHVTVISFPPHSSHKLQPLDVSFMGPLKTNFSQVIERYLKANPGKAVTINDVSELLGDAYLRSATPKNAIVGFDKTGLWPFNRHNFKLEDFAAAKATDVLDNFETDQEKPLCPPPAPVEPTPGQHPVPAEPSSKQSLLSPVDPISGQPPVPDEPSVGQRPDLAESTSKQTLLSPVEPISGQPPVPVEPTSGQSLLSPGELTPGRQGFTVSPEAIKPLPKVAGRKIASGRRRQKATELTSDTYRNALKASEANKEVSEIRKSKKRLAKVTSETSTKKKKRDGKAGKENVNDSLCAICGAVFSNFNDDSEWEKCHTCAEWFHCCVDNSCPTCNV